MAVRTIALVDHTRRHRPPDGALEAIAEALTIQIERDFCPAWHREPVRVTVGGRGDKIHFFDTSHDAIDYGWHYVDGDGLPYAHVFVEPSIKNGSDADISTGVVKLAPDLPLDGHFPFLHLDRKFMHLGFHIYDVGFQSPNVEAAKPMVYTTTILLLAIVVMLNLTAIVVRNRLRRKYQTSAF